MIKFLTKNKIYSIYAFLFVVFILLNYLSTQHFYNHISTDSYSKAKEIDYTVNRYADLCLKNHSKSECMIKINKFLQYYPKQYYGFQINAINKDSISVLFDNRKYKDNERNKTVELRTDIKSLNQPITIVINSVPNMYRVTVHSPI